VVKHTLETVYLNLYENEKDDAESTFYWDRLFEVVEQYGNPAYNKVDVSNAIYDCAAPFGRAREMLGLRRGLELAFRLAADTMVAKPVTQDEAEHA